MLQLMLFAYFWTLFPFFRKKIIFLKNGVWGSLYPLMLSNFMQNMKKNLMSQFLAIYKKVDFFQLLCPLLAVFWVKGYFYRKVTTTSSTSYGNLSLCKKIQKTVERFKRCINLKNRTI